MKRAYLYVYLILVTLPGFANLPGQGEPMKDSARKELLRSLDSLAAGKAGSALKILFNAISEEEARAPADSGLLADLLNQSANCYLILGDPSAARVQFYKAQRFAGRSLVAASVTFNIGNLDYLAGDLERGKSLFLEALDLVKRYPAINSPLTALIYHNLGRICLKEKNASKALYYFEREEYRISRDLPADDLRLARVWNSMGAVSFLKNDIPGALAFLGRSLRVYRRYPAAIPERSLVQVNLARVLVVRGMMEKASAYLDSALEENSTPGMKSDIYPFLIREKARVLEKTGQYRQALRLLETGCKLNGRDQVIPDLADKIEDLSLQADILFKAGLEDHDAGLLRDALHSYKEAARMADYFLPGACSERSKLVFEEKIIPLYKKAVLAGYTISEWTNQSMTEELFSLSDLAHSPLLWNILLKEKALEIAKIPDFLIQRMDESERSVASLLASRLRDEHSPEALADLTEIADPHAVLLFKTYDSVERAIQKNFPFFRQWMNMNRETGIDEIRAGLDDRTALIEYLDCDSIWLRFYLDKDTLSIGKIRAGAALHELINEFSMAIQSLNPDGTRMCGKKLYGRLFDVAGQKLLAKDKIIYVGDGVSCRIPADLLLKISSGRQRHCPALINQFSARQWCLGSHWPAAATAGFLGYAPFADRSDPPEWLPESGKEVISIARLFCTDSVPASTFSGPQAGKENFTSLAGRFRIIHIATHCRVDESMPEFSALLFRSPNKARSVLESWEASALRLHADLVVLNACGSGTGRIAEGEGVLSLTRDFIKAGARNVLYTLWNVPDDQAREFITVFYRYVLAGSSYGEALERSKQRMSDDPGRSSPFYWAGYQLTGF